MTRGISRTQFDQSAPEQHLVVPESDDEMRRGDAGYGRARSALFLAGFATFSLLWCTQPLLPAFAAHFGLSAPTSALAQSMTAGAIAGASMVAAALSHLFTRRRLMFTVMLVASLLNLAVAFAPSWPTLLFARFLQGAALGGVPVVAMAYLAEEMDDRDLPRAIGLYVAGTAFGAMMGRVAVGVIADLLDWRGAMAVVGMIDVAAAIGFLLLLPASRNFTPSRGFDIGSHFAHWRDQFGSPALCRLFAVGFVLTSVFVVPFNYAGFRLSRPPYDLGQAASSLIFLTYVFGIASSAQVGRLIARIGPGRALAASIAVMTSGMVISLAEPLWAFILGIILVTMGFFASHAIASGEVGRQAGPAKAHAASLYLLFYYAGVTLTGWGAGWFWEHSGWLGLTIVTTIIGVAGVVLALGSRD
ncbi:MFS transporter [Rhizorhabdus sp.]|uniref:MFS transporter n=1 Tax=Rhizorhabdus sp. TaxID=1968843 RepID=UPI0025E94A04|nr:MFS transporter [Rhizorhabdus sp.]